MWHETWSLIIRLLTYSRQERLRKVARFGIFSRDMINRTCCRIRLVLKNNRKIIILDLGK